MRDGVTGRVVPIDHDAFVDAAIAMLQNPAMLRDMGIVAANFARAELAFDTQVEQTLAVYRRLLERTNVQRLQ